MIDHMSTYTTDYLAAKSFYQAVFSVLGYSLQIELVAEWNHDFPTQRMCAFGVDGQFTFWLIETKEKFTPRHVAFSAASRSAVVQFHDQALQHGGTDNGEPGLRPMYQEHYYAAFAIDVDGNNVEAVCHLPE
ncbi:VOC family protein [Celerinatantimonas yamalensis]|uniref:VOC family protein n=1 Tax=Celerinatantimonas yamalensis TaxID=559956 RepID=A0ABW9G4Z9_9GAMM